MFQKHNFLLLFLLFAGFTYGQTTYISTTDFANWTQNTSSTINSNPIPWSTMLGLTYAPTAIYPSTCYGGAGNQSVAIMPEGTSCGQSSGGTSFYKTTFFLSPNALCQTKATIRADNLFRVFINGTQLAPGYSFNGCDFQNLNSLNGIDWQTTYSFNNFESLLVTGAQNTIIVEVSNCALTSFLSANFTIRQVTTQPDPFIPVQIYYTFSSNTFSGIDVTLGGTNFKHLKSQGIPGPFSANWLIEIGPSNTGPWTFYESRNEPPMYNATQFNPWTLAVPNYSCTRITYTVYTGCNHNTNVYVICFGIGEKPSGMITGNESGGIPEMKEIDSSVTADPSGLLSHTEAIPADSKPLDHKVYSDQNNQSISIQIDGFDEDEFAVNIFSLNGRLVYSAPKLTDQITVLDVYNWNNGIYFVEIQSKSGQFSETKKVALIRP